MAATASRKASAYRVEGSGKGLRAWEWNSRWKLLDCSGFRVWLRDWGLPLSDLASVESTAVFMGPHVGALLVCEGNSLMSRESKNSMGLRLKLFMELWVLYPKH